MEGVVALLWSVCVSVVYLPGSQTYYAEELQICMTRIAQSLLA